jgi:hypothetical protein
MSFSDENEFRIRELDYDYMDADAPVVDKEDEPQVNQQTKRGT